MHGPAKPDDAFSLQLETHVSFGPCSLSFRKAYTGAFHKDGCCMVHVFFSNFEF
jgi:hypothetical protein